MIGLAALGALVVAAFVPEARPLVLVVLGAGALLAPRGSVALWASAAGLPVAVILAWGALAGNQSRTDLLDCANVLSPAAAVRVTEALLVGAVIVLLARRLRVPMASLGLVRPSRTEVVLGGLAIAVIPIFGLLIGGILAEPFFGPVRLHLGEPLAIVPALALATANGTMEELAYRGALMAWMSRASGPLVALLGQAIVFGAAHTGADYVGSAIAVVLVIASGGLIAGLIVRRTGSLWLPIVVHVCFDVPLYYAAVCRLS
jgi:membrane protease YdiL (CAAX protease family)